MRLFTLLLALLFALPVSAKTYRWVDEDGQVHYGDHIPAQHAQKNAQEINSQGVVVKERNRPQTSAEIATEQARLKAEEEARLKEREQARYDEFLLSTYATQDQLILRRDEQINILDGRIALGDKSVMHSRASLEKLNQRAATFTQQKKPVPAKITAQIQQFERAIEAGNAALLSMKSQRDEVFAQFEKDLERFLQLQQQP